MLTLAVLVGGALCFCPQLECLSRFLLARSAAVLLRERSVLGLGSPDTVSAAASINREATTAAASFASLSSASC